MSKNTLKTLFSLVITGVCLYFVFKHVEWPKLRAALAEANVLFILASVLVYMLSMFVRAFRWHWLLKPIKEVPSLRLFPPVIMGYAGNNLFPLRAGEFIRAYASGKLEKISRSASFATIMVERIFDGLTMALLLSVALLTMDLGDGTEVSTLRYVLWLGGAAFAVAFAACLALIFQRELALRLVERIFEFETRGFSDKLLQVIHKFLTGLEALRSAKDVALVMFLSLCVWSCEVTMYYLIGLSLPDLATMSFFQHLTAMAVINLVIMIPAAPGFAGTFEYAGKKTLAMFGYSTEVAVLYTLLVHLAQYLPTTIIGGGYMLRYNIRPSRANAEQTDIDSVEVDAPTGEGQS